MHFIGGYLWHYFQWTGISIAGFSLALLTLVVHLIGSKMIDKEGKKKIASV